MKIAEVRVRTEDLQLTRPYTIAFRTVEAVSNVVVTLHAEGGRVGAGTASPEPYVTGEDVGKCEAALADLDWLVGWDVRELTRACRELDARLPEAPAARAAVDIALHDLWAQYLEKPLVEVLGRAHEALPTSITIGIKSVEDTLVEAEEYRGRGFRVLKVKLGHSLDEDLERLRKLRERFGEALTVRVDPNQGYDAAQVGRFVEESRSLGVEFLEQPMPVDALEEQRALPEEVRRRIAADESLLSARDALELLREPRACGIFNIKLMKCGGIREAGRIAALATLADVELMWGCMDESVVSISAALHAALASPATRYLDLDGSFDLARDVATGGFVLQDGVLRTAEGAGLGLRLSP